MKVFNKIFTAVILILTVLFVSANIILAADNSGGRPYRVEIWERYCTTSVRS